MIAVGLELNVVYIGTTYKAIYVWLPRLALETLERKKGEVRISNYYNHMGAGVGF